MRGIRVVGTIRRTQLVTQCAEETLTSPRPVRVGSTRRAVVKTVGGRTSENHAVCTAFELNRRIAWRNTPAPVPFEVTVNFTPHDGGTRVDSIWTWVPKAVFRPAAPLLDLMFRRRWRGMLTVYDG
jgi:uncharacterized protein YndB with AHSA1/START domain